MGREFCSSKIIMMTWVHFEFYWLSFQATWRILFLMAKNDCKNQKNATFTSCCSQQPSKPPHSRLSLSTEKKQKRLVCHGVFIKYHVPSNLTLFPNPRHPRNIQVSTTGFLSICHLQETVHRLKHLPPQKKVKKNCESSLFIERCIYTYIDLDPQRSSHLLSYFDGKLTHCFPENPLCCGRKFQANLPIEGRHDVRISLMCCLAFIPFVGKSRNSRQPQPVLGWTPDASEISPLDSMRSTGGFGNRWISLDFHEGKKLNRLGLQSLLRPVKEAPFIQSGLAGKHIPPNG